MPKWSFKFSINFRYVIHRKLRRMEKKLKQTFEQANIATKPAKAEEPVVKVTKSALKVTMVTEM